MLQNRLSEYRRARGLTQQELAVQAGLSISTVAKLEQGRVTPELETARAVSGVLKIPIDEIWPTEPATTPDETPAAQVR